MAFSKQRLYSTGGNATNTIKSYNYYNSGSDDVTASGYFDLDTLAVGDQISVISADYGDITDIFIGSVSDGAGTAGSATDIIGLAGALSISSELSTLVTVGAIAITLADGVEGQKKTIVMTTDGGTATLTPASFGNGATIVFADVLDAVQLVFTTGKWYVTSLEGAVVG